MGYYQNDYLLPTINIHMESIKWASHKDGEFYVYFQNITHFCWKIVSQSVSLMNIINFLLN